MFSKRALAFCFLSFTMSGLSVAQDRSDQQTTPVGPIQRLYVEERTKARIGDSVHCDFQGSCFSHEGENAQSVSVEVTKRCPAVLASTDNRNMADYYLRIALESSILYRRSGEIAYTFSAKFDVSNLTKDLCAFAKKKAPVEMDSPMIFEE
jgi:hypothetical protein